MLPSGLMRAPNPAECHGAFAATLSVERAVKLSVGCAAHVMLPAWLSCHSTHLQVLERDCEPEVFAKKRAKVESKRSKAYPKVCC